MKKPYQPLLTISMIISLFSSCKSDYRNAIEESARKYPELYKENPANSFDVVRVLDDKRLKITMRLLQSGYQQVVVLSDSVGRAASIPFPDNDYCGYWRFCNDSSTNHRYFNDAVNNCFRSLAITGKSKQYAVIDDLLISLTDARPVTLVDSARLKLLIVGCRQDTIKTKQSYQTVIRCIKTAPFYWNYTTYSDQRHGRIYQIDIVNDSLVLNAYKAPCVITHLFRL